MIALYTKDRPLNVCTIGQWPPFILQPNTFPDSAFLLRLLHFEIEVGNILLIYPLSDMIPMTDFAHSYCSNSQIHAQLESHTWDI